MERRSRLFTPLVAAVAMVAAASASAAAAGQTRASRAASAVSTDATCHADLGVGVKTRRKFCDVMIGPTPNDGVRMAIPRHVGAATLMFDLHNRFATSAGADPLAALTQTALVAVVNAKGAEIKRAAVMGQMRSHDDVFDDLRGASPASVRAIAPGFPESVRIQIPAGLSEIAIVGLSVSFMTADGRDVISTPGRPVAIVSNLRVQYQPAK